MGRKIVRIGGGSASVGDSITAGPQLIAAGVDYLVLDYLAEAMMSVLGNMRRADPKGGYARDFTDWLWKDHLASIKKSGVRIVTNAGGLNPAACAARVEALAAEAGLTFRVAVVTGDELIDRVDAFAAAAERELYKGTNFPDPSTVLSANAYLGAAPIVRALEMGAEVVITGRVVDSALTLGPLIHEFGWALDDYDRLAAGSLAGHVIECGAQATGGLFTDWRRVPDWAHIGYPIIECEADGTFVVTKPEGTGGLVEPATVGEQILYEIGNPQAYMLPDVVCDFSQVRVASQGRDRVRVTGAVGYPPTGRYKVTVTHTDGWRCFGLMGLAGREAPAKARREADEMLARVNELLRNRNLPPFRATNVEILGAESSYGARARPNTTREVVYKVGVEHVDKAALRVFRREFNASTISMAVGTAGWWAGGAEVATVDRVFSFTIDPATLRPVVQIGKETVEVPVAPPAQIFSPDKVRPLAAGEALSPPGKAVERPLIDLAWARSGDKGDAFNVGVIARRAEYLPYIRAALTEESVAAFFEHEFEAGVGRVTRYELPGLNALNFHCENSLGGGQRASLRFDPLAKAKAQQLLDFPIPLPPELAAGVAPQEAEA